MCWACSEALRNCIEVVKKEIKGIGGKGKLTNELVDKLQNYYGIAIRANAGDLNKMKRAIMQAFFIVLQLPAHHICMFIVLMAKNPGVGLKKIRQNIQIPIDHQKEYHSMY